MLDGLQIERALLADPATLSCFMGVYSSDNIPSHISFYPYCMVWNTEEKNESGEHWVAVYQQSPSSSVEYFDSYGLPPLLNGFKNFIQSQKASTFVYNLNTFQSLTSTVCGYYCLYVLGLRCRGWGWVAILNSIPSSAIGESDDYIRVIVSDVYKL